MINIKLTDRDIKLMHDLYSNVFLSFEQIRREHFKNCATSTVYNRLSKLVNANMIETINVNIKANYLLPKDVGVIYSLSKLGLIRLKEYWHREIQRIIPAPINLSCLYHDLLLTDVIRKLKEQINCSVINSKIMDMSGLNYEQVPDAILFNSVNKTKWAIEVELTAKSNQRYREIVSNYATSNLFEKVLYIVKDESIRRKIGGIITGHGSQFNLTDDTGKFKFIDLNKFILGQKSEVKCEL